MNIIKSRSPHSGRLERWLGAEKIERLQFSMRHGGGPNCPWYYKPIDLLDIPGSLKITADGDFVGGFDRGFFASAADFVFDKIKKLWIDGGRPIYIPDAIFAANSPGFASISAILARSSAGNQWRFTFQKSGPTGVANAAGTLWRVASQPSAGGAGSAAPGGRACDDSTTGGVPYTNPSTYLHLTGADFFSSVAGNHLLLYDRLFDVAKTMNSTSTEAVSGVPTRYQSTTPADQDYVGGNFLTIEVFAALAATAHNWTVCQYTDQGGNTAQSIPSVAGISGAIIDRLDLPLSSWFTPLAAGDFGIKALTQMQCDAAVATGSINFVIGHPIGFMVFPLGVAMWPFDWITNREQTPRIFDDACLSLLEMPKPNTTQSTYSGTVYATSTA